MSATRSSLGLGPLLVALVIILALGVGTVYAAIPNGSGTYYACLRQDHRRGAAHQLPQGEHLSGGREAHQVERHRDRRVRQGPGPQGPGTPGTQGPAGPADWNAIPNKPAGFADGVDNVGYVSTTYPDVHSLLGGDYTWVLVEIPVGTDVELTLIPVGPAGSENVEVVEELFESHPGGLLRHYYRVEPWGTGAVDFKVRSRVYNTGIAPAALKKAAKSIKVRVTDRGPLKSR